MAAQRAVAYAKYSTKDNAAAYNANYGAHKEGITKEEMASYYTKWAVDGKYEKDITIDRYQGARYAAEEIAKSYPKYRENIKILDIAAGTGYLGEELYKCGFRNMDALDPSQGMLDIAKEKKIYNTLYCDFITDQELQIEKDAYDCVAVSGGMGEGHIPRVALHEMIRITKPGGLVVIMMREEYLNYVEDYKEKLEPLMKQLDADGKWKATARELYPKYSFDNNGVLFKFEIC